MKMKWVATFFILLHFAAYIYGIGVNWGLQSSDNLPPSVIIQLLKDNKINQIKLFDSDQWTVKQFAGTGLEVMLGVPNDQLADFAKDYSNAQSFVKNNVTKFLGKDGIYVRYVAVGNEPFLKSYNGSNLNTIFPAVKNVQKALDEAGVGDKIKATIPQNADVYDSGTLGPSNGNFRGDIRSLMVDIVKFFAQHNTPFLVNIYPFLSLSQSKDFPVEFAFFDGGAKPVEDHDIKYENMLDANLDTLVASLKKAGVPKMKIIIGEIGWPTDGHEEANVKNAKKFYDGFFKKMASKKGTPKYPGEIEYYLFSLTDENQKSIAPGDFERHWGIFYYDGKPKYEMDFTGNGNDKLPVAAKGVKYLGKKWCVFNTDVKMLDQVQASVNYACSRSDCTALEHNSSCGKMDKSQKFSYAFNSFFQVNDQDVESCNFDGQAKMVDKDPSVNNCYFPLALESGGRRLAAAAGAAAAWWLLVLVVVLF